MQVSCESLFESGGQHYRTENYKEAFRCFELAAELGHIDSQYMAGIMLDNGQGVARDYSRALKWFDRAARQGSAIAEFCLGVMYRDGHGVAQNYREAARLIGVAAAKGNAEAQFNLGVMYLHGHGVEQSLDLAETWWCRASVQGHGGAETNLKTLSGLTSRQPNCFTWHGEALSCSEDLEGYFSIQGASAVSSKSRKEVLIIQEPHFHVRCQWNLFCGLELLLERLRSHSQRGAESIFLAEGIPAYEEVVLKPLIDRSPSPSDSTIYAVLRSFLLPGYVAYEWRHRAGIRIFGMENAPLYELSARLWEEERTGAWHSTVPARNKQISEVIGHYLQSADHVIAFIGGMHMRAIPDDEFAASVDQLRTSFSQPAHVVHNIGNRGLGDYLIDARIGYTFLDVRGAPAVDTEADVARYRELFRAQRTGNIDRYVRDFAATVKRGVTVSPDVKAAAKLASIIPHGGDGSESNDPDSKRRTGESKRKEKKDIEQTAKRHGIDPNELGPFVEDAKEAANLPNNFRYSSAELNRIALDLKAQKAAESGM